MPILTINHIWFVLFLMLFLHVLDDFGLQGILAQMKCKDWWTVQQGYNYKYRFDYIVCLIVHGFSWAFIVMLPIFYVYNFELSLNVIGNLIFHSLFHAYVDDGKANDKSLNLVQDQSIHLVQILVMWTLIFSRLG